MDLGDAKITIKVDDKASGQLDKIGRNAEAMSKKFRTMGKVMVGVGIAIAGALAGAVVMYAKAGDEVHKMALRTGFATEALSELRHVAMLSGTDLSSIEKATKKMAKTIVDASDGMVTYIRAFDRIGLSAEALLQLAPEEQFWTIAKAIGDLEDPTLKAATAVDIFGRAGTMLLPMLEMTSEQLTAAQQAAHDTGIVFDEEAAAKAAVLTDAMGTLKESLQGVAFALAEDLVPSISDFLENKVIPTIQSIKDWITENEGLAKTLGVVAGIFIAGGALLLGLSFVAKAIMAINAALIIMHGLMGPAGWAKLAAGIAIAGGAIFAIKQLTKTPEVPGLPEATVPVLESKQYGGVVSGPIGKPVPIMAHGGEQFAGVGKSFGAVNIYIGSYMGDESSLRAFSRKVKEIIGQDTRRTSFPSINRLEYFPGSSAV